MATVTRKKYRFASRQEAEDRQQQAEQERFAMYRLATSLLLDEVVWMGRKQNGYRLGYFGLGCPVWAYVVQVFAPGGQRPLVEVWTHSEFEDHRNNFARHAYGAEDHALVSQYDATLAAIREAGKSV